MKKILLITFLIMAIFQIMVLAMTIDIGCPAVDRENIYSSNVYTVVNIGNPANASGHITEVEIYPSDDDNMLDVKVATFFIVSGNNLSTRDYEMIGTVVKGAKRTFTVNIDVLEGDYIGFVASNGARIKSLTTGGEGTWYSPIDTDYIPCTNKTFGVDEGWDISLYGTGVTEKTNAIFFGTNF